MSWRSRRTRRRCSSAPSSRRRCPRKRCASAASGSRVAITMRSASPRHLQTPMSGKKQRRSKDRNARLLTTAHIGQLAARSATQRDIVLRARFADVSLRAGSGYGVCVPVPVLNIKSVRKKKKKKKLSPYCAFHFILGFRTHLSLVILVCSQKVELV